MPCANSCLAQIAIQFAAVKSYIRDRQVKPLTYPTIVHNVREIALLGAADFEYWRKQLRAFDLHPFNDNGRARLLISATSLKWNNIAARECVFAVLLSRDANAASFDGSFLLHAFNSRRFFAWAERRAFATPYYHAALDFEIRPPRFQARIKNETILTATRHAPISAPTTDETWEYPILLPPLDGSVKPPQKFFYAKLTGATHIAPFAATDEFDLPTTARAPIFQQLRESNFTPTEWHLRADATHCKSNTFTVGKDAPTAFDR